MFNFINQVLESAMSATYQHTLNLLADCIALRHGDDWLRTPYGKATVVRNRGNVIGKENKETTSQYRLIAGAETPCPATAAGYNGQLVFANVSSTRLTNSPIAFFSSPPRSPCRSSFNSFIAFASPCLGVHLP